MSIKYSGLFVFRNCLVSFHIIRSLVSGSLAVRDRRVYSFPPVVPDIVFVHYSNELLTCCTANERKESGKTKEEKHKLYQRRGFITHVHSG
jgi:hypothetical protein